MSSDDLDPDAARVFKKVRRLMALSVIFTGIAVAAVLGVIGYRVSRNEGSRPAGDLVATLPAGSKILSASIAEGRVLVTAQSAQNTELYIFDLTTLQLRGRVVVAP